MQPVKLFYLRPSHYCEKARAILAYKEIPYELVDVPYGDHTQVIAASGQDYVPYLEVPWGNKKGVLWHEVADWAEAARGDPSLYPDPNPQRKRAASRLLEHWAHQVVEEAVWKFVLPDVPARLREGRERWIFVELQERKRGPLEVLALQRASLREGVVQVCMLAQDLLKDQEYLLGNEPSLADFALYGALHPLKFTGHEIPKEAELLRAWHARVGEEASNGPVSR